MPAERDVRADAGPAVDARSTYAWLTSVVLLALAAVGAWFVFGAVTAPEPAAFFVDPRTDLTPAVAVAVGTDAPSESGPPSAAGDAETGPIAVAGVVSGNADRVDRAWAAATAAATGIPERVLRAYAGAELAMASERAGCGIRWSTLAALGAIESAHGTHDGSAIGEDGVARPGIFGIDLTGSASARITDTDGGRWDGKAEIDRAVGPMQFIPATWETWGADGNADGMRDPQHIDDAALAAARYLCHDQDLTDPASWRQAIFSYNHLDSYVDAVAQKANDYAQRAAG